MSRPRQGIPWSITFSPEAYCAYCGVRMRDYHADPELMMHVQLEGPRMMSERFGTAPRTYVYPDFSSYVGASVLGLEVGFLDDQPPSPKDHPVKSAEQAAGLRVPNDLSSAGMIPQALERYQYMKQHAPDGVSVTFPGSSQGPFTTAVLLRGNGIFLDVYENPQLVHRFMATLRELSIRMRELAHQVNETTPGAATGFSDDYAGMLAPGMYEEFALDYVLQVAEHFGATQRSIHTELVRREHLRILQDAGFSFIDVGADPYIGTRDCADILDVDFMLYIYTCPEHLLSTPEQVKDVYRRMVADGAVMMRCDVCPGVPDENIDAFIEVAREYE